MVNQVMKIVIDGIIGAGKTTQLDLLEQKGLTVKREPIHEWPLELFYSDMSRWALTLQLAIFQTLQPIDSLDPVVYERTILASRYVFWELLKQQDKVKAVEDSIHERAFEKYLWHPDVYIYLAADPQTAFERIQVRKQVGDQGVTFEYLKDIHGLYQKLVSKMPCYVHIVKTDGRTAEEIHEEILRIIQGYGVHVNHHGRSKMQKARPYRRQVLCTPFSNMCHMS